MLLIIVFCFTSRAELLERDVHLDKRGCGAMRAGGEDNLRVGILVHILETTNDAYDEEKSPLDVGEEALEGSNVGEGRHLASWVSRARWVCHWSP